MTRAVALMAIALALQLVPGDGHAAPSASPVAAGTKHPPAPRLVLRLPMGAAGVQRVKLYRYR